MTLIEEISNRNMINNIKIEDDTNITYLDSSNFISKQNIHKIQSILSETNFFKHIIVKDEIECFYSQINNCSIKERIVLNTLINLNKCKNKKESKFLSYNDIINKTDENNKNNNYDNEEDFNIENKIFEAVERVTHKTLHKNILKDGKNIKVCSIYNELNQMEFKETENINYSNIDKLIQKLKKKNNLKHLEFIAIKAIIIGIINLIEELISNYLQKSEDMNIINNLYNEEYYFGEDDENFENNIIIFKPDIFKTILNDYLFISNNCRFLENYFIESFNLFRETHQISFTLTELFIDIFWNYIFHNKILCNKFINIYIGNDACSDNIRTILSEIIKIITGISIPLKSQILQLLLINNIEDKDDIDLMTSIVKQKSINHDLIKNENILNNVNKNREYIDIINNNDEKNNEKNNPNNIIINENDLEHKTVDEVYNYINDNKEIKSKKKKRTKKKKNKKIENEIITFNEDNENKKDNNEDVIVSQFKKDIDQNSINANTIIKIKPIISDNWLSKISNY